MSFSPSLCKETLRQMLEDAGVVAWGVAVAEPLTAAECEEYDCWVGAGCHGEMAYLERYGEVRRDPRLLLEGARSVISCAFPYYTALARDGKKPQIASYALGDDYHEVLRRCLEGVKEWLERMGERARICVDTAPLRERLWAVKAGVGFMGRNNMLIVPGAGSYVFLAEILTTASFEPDAACEDTCLGCDACVSSCPGHAIDGEKCCIDARRCQSYLTIEYRGESFPEGTMLGDRLYGCEVCQEVCPHNKGIPATTIAEFKPRKELMGLTAYDLATMSSGEYKRLVKHSAMSRARLWMIQRNLQQIKGERHEENQNEVSSSRE